MPDFLSTPYKMFLLFDYLLAGWAYKYITKCLKAVKTCFTMVPLTPFLQIMVLGIKLIPKRYKVSSGYRKLGWNHLREHV